MLLLLVRWEKVLGYLTDRGKFFLVILFLYFIHLELYANLITGRRTITKRMDGPSHPSTDDGGKSCQIIKKKKKKEKRW
jgi:hypothetical protein